MIFLKNTSKYNFVDLFEESYNLIIRRSPCAHYLGKRQMDTDLTVNVLTVKENTSLIKQAQKSQDS